MDALPEVQQAKVQLSKELPGMLLWEENVSVLTYILMYNISLNFLDRTY